MAVAPVEVYKSTTYPQAIYYLHQDFFELAQFFSQSAHFNIIDSYSAHYDSNKDGSPSYTSYRWKGDPIADDDDGSLTVPPGSGQAGHKVWESYDDVGATYDANNPWIVIECQTQHPDLAGIGFGALPKWQAKIQVAGDWNSFADVSDPTGVKYPKNHTGDRKECIRLGPYGGWDKADSLPDFNPSSPPLSGDVSTNNHKISGANSGGRDARWIMVCANGCFILMSRYNDQGREFYRLYSMIGDVLPITNLHMPMPRCLYCCASGGMLEESSNNLLTSVSTNSASDYAVYDNAGGGIAFMDKNETLLESYYALDEKDHFYYYVSNPFAPTAELDVFPVYPFPLQMTPTPRAVFTYPYLRRSKNPGTMLFENKQWAAFSAAWGPIIPWDGSSNIY